MKNNQNIQISIKDQGRHIKINLPPKTKFLEKSLSLINKTERKDIKDKSSDEINDYSDCPYFISRQLTKTEKFRKVFNRVLEENQDYNYCRFTLSNIQIINKGKNNFLTSYKLNAPECKKQLLSSLNSINTKNVKFIIMHISSKISDDEKQIVLDNIYQIFIFIPIIVFKSNRNNGSTFVEIIYFGENVKRYQTDDPW